MRRMFLVTAALLLTLVALQPAMGGPPAVSDMAEQQSELPTASIGWAAYELLDSDFAGFAVGGAFGGGLAYLGGELGAARLAGWGVRLGISVGGLAGAVVGGLAGAL